MNDNLIIEIKQTINALKYDIIEKQIQFDSLVEKYEELTNEDIG